jgi:hypothetical protein
MIFNDAQKAEIREMAQTILSQEKWDSLPWDEAWSGAYPVRAYDHEIEFEAKRLEEKALRIISGGSLEHEYSTQKEHIRMICLEHAESFSIYEHSLS